MIISSKTKTPNADEKWIEKGVDIWLIRENLTLSFEERITQHQKMLELIDDLKQIGFQNRAKSSDFIKSVGPKPR